MQKFAFALAALAITGAATSLATSPAMAESRSLAVETTGYDLGTAAGYAAIANRIDRAADAVCGTVDFRDQRVAELHRQCSETAAADAMDQLSRLSRSPSVTVGASR